MNFYLIPIVVLILAGIISLYLIRLFQKYLVHSVAHFLEFAEPEREREGNGLFILAKLFFSGILLLYLVGAWCAVCVVIPRTFQQTSSVVYWVILVVGLIYYLAMIAASTKVALGFSNPEQLNAYIHTNTKAKWEKADSTFMFAVASSTILFWLGLVIWIVFVVFSKLPLGLYGWLINLISF